MEVYEKIKDQETKVWQEHSYENECDNEPADNNDIRQVIIEIVDKEDQDEGPYYVQPTFLDQFKGLSFEPEK